VVVVVEVVVVDVVVDDVVDDVVVVEEVLVEVVVVGSESPSKLMEGFRKKNVADTAMTTTIQTMMIRSIPTRMYSGAIDILKIVFRPNK
jgi:hypothetical protein